MQKKIPLQLCTYDYDEDVSKLINSIKRLHLVYWYLVHVY